jgi:hypothetical protein
MIGSLFLPLTNCARKVKWSQALFVHKNYEAKNIQNGQAESAQRPSEGGILFHASDKRGICQNKYSNTEIWNEKIRMGETGLD